MVKIEENVPLAPLTTMRTGGNARFLARVKTLSDLRTAALFAREHALPIFVLGGGSNILVSDLGFLGLVIKIEMIGVTYEEKGDGIEVTVGGGEKWDNFVSSAVARSLWGIENLSLIPGTVGGAIVQNIGAYGALLEGVVVRVEAFDIETMEVKTFSRMECAFGYRQSIFKKSPHIAVVRAVFTLARTGLPNFSYEEVNKYFKDRGIAEPTLSEMRLAIIAVRTAKLPPETIGTAGSFFKNPIVSKKHFEQIKQRFPEIKAYLQGDDGTVKLSGAWLLDKIGGWRGARRGDAGVYERQALVIVNYGTATAREIVLLAEDMKRSIKEKIGVELEEEVVIMGHFVQVESQKS